MNTFLGPIGDDVDLIIEIEAEQKSWDFGAHVKTRTSTAVDIGEISWLIAAFVRSRYRGRGVRFTGRLCFAFKLI